MRFSPRQENPAWLFELQCWTGCPYLTSAAHIPKCFSRKVMKAMIRLIKQTRLKSDIRCHISSDVFPHSEVLLGVSKEAMNLSNSAMEKQLIRCKETVFAASFTVSAMQSIQLCSETGLGSHSCQSLCRLMNPGSLCLLPFWPFAPYSPSSMVTNSRQVWEPIPVLPTTAWPPRELGQEFKPMKAEDSWGLPTETETSLISPNVTVALILFCQTALNLG